MKNKNKNGKKKRNEYLYGTTVGNVSELIITTNSLTGEISFEGEMCNVYSEISYDRPKGPKVISRIPQDHRQASFNQEEALVKNYEYLCAVDTNTQSINGKNVSVVGIVTFQSLWLPESEGLTRYWKYDVPFCIEYVEIKEKPENFGWIAAIEHLRDFSYITNATKMGMVVDSDLGNIKDYNTRKKGVLGSYLLPDNIQLLYASADTGKENIANQSLSVADSVSSQCLEAIKSGSVPFNNKERDNNWFESMRIIQPNLD